MTGVLLDHEIDAGAAWSVLLRRGRELRLTALGDGANCSTLVLDPHSRDRLNIPDTLKAQMSARITPPMVLMSDRGIGLASVTGSSLDWHDCITGHSTDAHLARFGPSAYTTDRNGWRRSARHGLLSELRKHGRGEADLHACVNVFSRVQTSSDPLGPLTYDPAACRAGDWLALRAEVDLLVVCSTAPHPMAQAWSPSPVRAQVRPTEPAGDDDPSWTFRAESRRALEAARAVFA